MAYQTGSYTDQNNVLALFSSFLLSQGWVINDFADDSSAYAGAVFTGKRLHVQKSIEGVDYFFNLRSCSGQRVFSYDGYAYVTGICVNGSTGYSAGSTWDTQPNYTPNAHGDPASSGGCLDGVLETGGNYYFFESGSSAHMALDTGSANGELRFISIGATDTGKAVYSASGGSNGMFGSDYDYRSYYTSAGYGMGLKTNQNALYDPTSGNWFNGTSDNRDNTYVSFSRHSLTSPGPDYWYMENSPDPFRGNAPLPPYEFLVSETSYSVIRSGGVLSGVYFVNMKNYTEGQEISLGSDTYKCFSIYTPKDYGVVFKK